MRRRAKVETVEAGWAVVHVDRPPACHGCAGCGLHEERGSFRVVDELGVAPGDEVWVRMPARSFLHAALIVYGTPLAAGALGLVVGRFACKGLDPIWLDVGAFLGAFLFGGLALGGLWFWQGRGGGTSLLPRVEGRVDGEESWTCDRDS